MIPVLYRFPEWTPLVGDQAVTSFGVMLLLALLTAGAYFARRLAVLGVPASVAWDLAVFAAVGGLVGAKLMFAVENLPAVADAPAAMLTARGGLSWFGGLIGGAALTLGRARTLRIDAWELAAAATPPVLLGYAMGRIGCFLVGDDYGIPTALPWGVAFPLGAPPTTPTNLRELFDAVPGVPAGVDFVRVHPTQLYEAAAALALLGLVVGLPAVRARSRQRAGGPPEYTMPPVAGQIHAPVGHVLGIGLLGFGIARFAIEFLRVQPYHLLGWLTTAHLFAAAMAAGGIVVLRRAAVR